MCFSRNVSLITYVVVMLMVIILFIRNKNADRHIAIFSAVFVIIQLLEGIAWGSIEEGDRNQNDFVTRLILVFLWLQPISSIIGVMLYSPPTTVTGQNFVSVLIIVYLILFYNAIVTASAGEFETTKGENCHLVWNRTVEGKNNGFMSNHSIPSMLYMLGLFLPLLLIKPFKKGLIMTILGVVTLFIARFNSSAEEVSSWWCWVAGTWTFGALIV